MILFYYFGIFILLLLNQSRFVFGGDSAEFSLAARTMSVPHPPGYPLYTIFANIINAVVPFSTTPWRVATLSSLSTVFTAYILYRLLREWKVSNLGSILSSTLYIFLFPVWLYSEIPEVFALSNALVIGTTYFLVLFLKHGSRQCLYISAAIAGLCLGHHHIFILFIPAWIYLLMSNKDTLKKLKARHYVIAGAIGLGGLLSYIYPVVASLTNPPLDWENAKTASGLIRLFLRSTYGTFKAYSGASGNIINQFFDVFSIFVFILHDFRIIGIGLIITGFIAIRNNRVLLNFILILAATHVFFLFYTNFVLSGSFTLAMYERFLIPLYLILTIPLAFGTDSFISTFTKLIHRHLVNTVLKKLIPFILGLFLVCYVGIVVRQNYRTVSLVGNMDEFALYAKHLLDTVPEDSVFFVGADNSHFTSAYYRYGENYRKDVKFVFVNLLDKDHYRERLKTLYPDLFVPDKYKKGEDLLEFLSKNSKYGIYFENPLGVTTWKPYGLLWKYYESEDAASSDSAHLIVENKRLWNSLYKIPELGSEKRKILHLNVVQDHYIDAYVNYSKLLYSANYEDDAVQVIGQILKKYRKNDSKTKLIMSNLLISRKKCAEARIYVGEVPDRDIFGDLSLAKSVRDYYQICEKGNSKMEDLTKFINDAEINRKSTLKEF